MSFGPDVLAEINNPNHKGNFKDISRRILTKLASKVEATQEGSKHTYVSDG